MRRDLDAASGGARLSPALLLRILTWKDAIAVSAIMLALCTAVAGLFSGVRLAEFGKAALVLAVLTVLSIAAFWGWRAYQNGYFFGLTQRRDRKSQSRFRVEADRPARPGEPPGPADAALPGAFACRFASPAMTR